MARNYSSLVEPKALAADITSTSATTITLNNATGLPSPPYVLVIDPDTASEEVVLVTANASSPTLTVTRAIEASNGLGIAKTHTNNAVVKHMIVGSDLQIVHDHFSDNNTTTGTAHGATGGVVGRTNSQTLTNKTIALGSNTITGTKAQFNTAMTDADFATIDGTETLTNKTIDSASNTLTIAQSAVTNLVTDLAAKALLSPSTNAQSGTTYTLVLADAGKYVEMNNASANTLTVPLNSSVAFPTGTEITIIQTGAGATTVAPDAGVTVDYYSLSSAATRVIKGRWSAATLIKRATNTWVLIGNLQ